MDKTVKKSLFAAVAAVAFAGCWTFNETEYPGCAVTAVAGRPASPSVMLAGFESTVTTYDAVTGFQTVYVPGHCGRRFYHPGYYEAVPVTSYVANQRSSDQYLRRARDQFEKGGFTMAVANPDRIVEVDFDGPYMKDGDVWRQLAWEFCTLFFCDYGSAVWKAKLRIRDGKTGKLVFSHEYDQEFETHVFGLIPLFGISASSATSYTRMQGWCLAALTDRAVADATAFLAK